VKTGKAIQTGWKDLIPEYNERPEGYSTACEIARARGLSTSMVRSFLRKAREENKIKFMKAIVGGRLLLVYKD